MLSPSRSQVLPLPGNLGSTNLVNGVRSRLWHPNRLGPLQAVMASFRLGKFNSFIPLSSSFVGRAGLL